MTWCAEQIDILLKLLTKVEYHKTGFVCLFVSLNFPIFTVFVEELRFWNVLFSKIMEKHYLRPFWFLPFHKMDRQNRWEFPNPPDNTFAVADWLIFLAVNRQTVVKKNNFNVMKIEVVREWAIKKWFQCSDHEMKELWNELVRRKIWLWQNHQ